ncbi:proline-rich protein 2-like isoform X2 [Hippopotamus amphibius kiboko]|uniref:proline-rich protein 2-like isoform X2 n=1 Tax=Hippopotamus amphibius kiboko TaxID=575201 RepID=UPI002593C711|nr:proline-rich protein 2-like isoform X2 [Hippopotamus amphibius kiboko]
MKQSPHPRQRRVWERRQARPARRARAAPPPPPLTPGAGPPTPPHGSPPSRPTFAARAPGPGRSPRRDSARAATTAAEPPGRARPLPHAALFPGGRRQRAPQGWPGDVDPRHRTVRHSPATPHRSTKRSRSAMGAARPWATTAGSVIILCFGKRQYRGWI